jgi:hypothetical protein
MKMCPTILIPGIQGSKLADVNTVDFDIKWSFFQKYYESLNDLVLKEESIYDKEHLAIIERNELEAAAYKSIINEIKSKNPLLYIFGYDWRKSNAFNGRVLYDFVNFLKEKLTIEEAEPPDSFNFITHSMGGMVFSSFLNILKKEKGNLDLVNKAAINVCPFLGSVSALKALVIGDDGSDISLFNAADSFRKIARTFPSTYELLPVYPNSVISVRGQELSLLDKNNWQSNVYDDIQSLFDNRLKMLNNFRDSKSHAMLKLSELTENERKKFVIIAGTNVETQFNVIVDNEKDHFGVRNYIDFDSGRKDKMGDGIVRTESSTIYKDFITTILVERRLLDLAFHPMFLNDGRAQTIIKRFLFGSDEELASPDWWRVRGDSVRLA